ncbi:MAG: hypothetical protein HWE12_03090 [Oceanospirillaceae bacterium]|nr:hypothetical protein [Oceanospirillaceae bacterium]
MSYISPNRTGLRVAELRSSRDIFTPITPRGELECKVLVTKFGQTSVGFHVVIRNPEGKRCVEAEPVNVFVNNQTMTKIDIPQKYRERLEAYVAACGEIDV